MSGKSFQLFSRRERVCAGGNWKLSGNELLMNLIYGRVASCRLIYFASLFIQPLFHMSMLGEFIV